MLVLVLKSQLNGSYRTFGIDVFSAQVVAVSLNEDHTFSKINVETIALSKGLGVEADAHFGTTVQHLYIKKRIQIDTIGDKFF